MKDEQPTNIFEAVIAARTTLPILVAGLDRAHARLDRGDAEAVALERRLGGIEAQVSTAARIATENQRSGDRWRSLGMALLERLLIATGGALAAIGAARLGLLP